MASENKVSCIIPTFNEGPRIGNILNLVISHPLIDEVLVVDDGSTDNTRDIISKYRNIKLLCHEVNKGKTMALHTGIINSENELLFLVDADLIGLSSESITELIQPVINNIAQVSISLRKNSPWIDRLIGIDQISGERVLHKKLIEKRLPELQKLPKFGFETFLNEIIIKNKASIAVVFWKDVISPYPSKKRGFVKGNIVFLKMVRDILKVVSIFGVINQFIQMTRLKVKVPQYKELKISLIIPAYNEEKLLGACLEAAIKQQYGLHEIIVIDNASTDKTKNIAESFPGVRVIYEAEKGLTHARQKGLEVATGDLLAYIDADTLMPKGWVEKVQKNFSKKPSIVCLSGPYIYFDVPWYTSLGTWIYWKFLAYPSYLLTGYMTVGGNFVARKSSLISIGGFDTSIAFYGEDTNISKRLSKVGKVYFTHKLYMPTSGRRLLGEGVFPTAWRYLTNFLSVVFNSKPVSKEYNDIR